ncbi:MAG: hypothetical protein LUE20_04475 [Oscillospiraceae bacterium]|nr:hypothetical protein [Oscillospiraceae bacterium]
MAKSFKEFGEVAEGLIEKGNEAEREVKACRNQVASASSAVVAARAQLAAASETDESGNPKGDVREAQAQLSIAQNKLEANQRALSVAQGTFDKINSDKKKHVESIEQYSKTARSNLQKLGRLGGSAFGSDSLELTKGMAERLNEAEDIRVALLESMGINATAEHVPVGGSGIGNPWTVTPYSTLDLNGVAQSYHGGSSASLSDQSQVTGEPWHDDGASGTGIVGSRMSSLQPDEKNDGITGAEAGNISAGSSSLHENGHSGYMNQLIGEFQNPGLTIDEKRAILNAMQNILLCQKQQAEKEPERQMVRKKSPQQIWDEGRRYIDNMLEIYRDDLRDKGVADGPLMNAVIAEYDKEYTEILSADCEDGTYHLYEHKVPDFEELAAEINAKNELMTTTLKGKIPLKREKAAERAFRKAPRQIVEALNKCADKVKPITDSGYGFNDQGEWAKNCSYYSPSLQQVFMNDQADDSEYQETLPHELSHFLDHQRGWDSNKPEFVSAVEADLASMNRSTPEGRKRFNEMLSDAISGSCAAKDKAVSDLIFAVFGENGNDEEITAGFCKKGIPVWTHSDSYWMGIDRYGIRTPDGGASMRRGEIYAEIGAIRCLDNSTSRDFLKTYFPKIYEQYNEFYNIND